MDVDRGQLAEQLDDVVIGLRRLTLDRQGLSQPSMTALVSRLVDAGPVQRRTDPGDGRAVLLSLTAAGAELLDRRREDRAARLAGALPHP
ncbi:MarR family transcriptional regulator [Modestobacter excelsi]|uniref:MarR family transcriptional regulator n=1 Tax=Modestobacter excelsi TaxID=2213161 RepID=UPI001C20C904|nr:MarR family transcriptional regulator [Modestobacter excelsi]